jgi:hypothetical protein
MRKKASQHKSYKSLYTKPKQEHISFGDGKYFPHTMMTGTILYTSTTSFNAGVSFTVAYSSCSSLPAISLQLIVCLTAYKRTRPDCM